MRAMTWPEILQFLIGLLGIVNGSENDHPDSHDRLGLKYGLVNRTDRHDCEDRWPGMIVSIQTPGGSVPSKFDRGRSSGESRMTDGEAGEIKGSSVVPSSQIRYFC
jgi:hypothetical protein